METRFQTSFIPKSPVVVTNANFRAKKPRSIFSMIAITLFSLSLLSALGLFLWGKYITRQNEMMKESVQEQIKAFDPALTQELTALNSRIVSAKNLLSGHIALSELFDLISSVTVSSIQFSDFSFVGVPGGKMNITMKGRAPSYNALAYQSDVVLKDKNFTDPSFFDLGLDERGNVTFSFKSQIVSKAASYTSLIKAPEEEPAQTDGEAGVGGGTEGVSGNELTQ